MVNQSVLGNRIISSNGRDKLGSNLSIIVKILVMDSNNLTDGHGRKQYMYGVVGCPYHKEAEHQ